MSPSLRLGFAAVLAGSVACGCTATPLPEPPAETLDFGRIHGPEVSPAMNVIKIIGEPGAGPAGHMLRVTNLDGTDSPNDVLIADDGSFALSLPGDTGDELRFHVRLGRERDLPIDVVWSSGTVMPAARIECVQPEPLQQQDFGFMGVGEAPASRSIVLRNDCPSNVQVTSATLRTVGAAFTLGTPEIVLPHSIAPNDQATWTMDFAPSELGDAEEIFLLDLTVGGDAARYPITLYGDGE